MMQPSTQSTIRDAVKQTLRTNEDVERIMRYCKLMIVKDDAELFISLSVPRVSKETKAVIYEVIDSFECMTSIGMLAIEQAISMHYNMRKNDLVNACHKTAYELRCIADIYKAEAAKIDALMKGK